MRMSRHTMIVIAAVTTVAFGLGAQTVGAVGGQAIGDWQLNESRGATTLIDSSGNGHHGTIGNKVELGRTSEGATYHKFPYVSSREPSDPGRTHLIPSSSALNPGVDDFAVEVRFRTTVNDGNIVQKGQSGGRGFWKMELHRGGYGACVFQGTAASIGMSSDAKLSDGKWHVLRCERTRNSASLYVDGVLQSKPRRWSGDIQNNWEFVIGGKSRCTSAGVECDYYRGDLDYVRLERMSGSTPTTTTTRPPTTTTTTTTRPPETTTTRPPTTTTTTRPPTTTTTTTTTTRPPTTTTTTTRPPATTTTTTPPVVK